MNKLATGGWVTSVYPHWSLLSARGAQMVVGTAGLFALGAVLALAAGTMLRRSAGAITAVIALIVVPLVLATVLPMSPAQWLLRITPAAAFAVQQDSSVPPGERRLPPDNGCYPWAHGRASPCCAPGPRSRWASP